MIIKKTDSQKREFKGVNFDLLAYSEQTMLTKMNYKIGDIVPNHSHPNEQSGFVISGKFRIKFNNYDEIIEARDSYTIPKNIMNSLIVLEAGEVINVFVPIQKDYI
jgi:quercetin dioxygenase-like cupin family protein